MTPRPNDPHVGIVVEGRGDEFSIPVLLRKWLWECGEHRDLIGKPVTCHGRDKALVADGLEGFVAAAASRPGCVAVLCVFDAETDAACERGPELKRRAEAMTGKAIEVCLAEPQFEAWLVASAETMELDGSNMRRTGTPRRC